LYTVRAIKKWSGRGHTVTDRGHIVTDRGHIVTDRGHIVTDRGHIVTDRGHTGHINKIFMNQKCLLTI
jgi:hypothetical protein